MRFLLFSLALLTLATACGPRHPKDFEGAYWGSAGVADGEGVGMAIWIYQDGTKVTGSFNIPSLKLTGQLTGRVSGGTIKDVLFTPTEDSCPSSFSGKIKYESGGGITGELDPVFHDSECPEYLSLYGFDRYELISR